MTTSHADSTLPPATPDVLRGRLARALVAFIVAAAALDGCGLGLVADKDGASGRRAAPEAKAPVSELQQAREQAALSPGEPYWPYRIAQIQLAADSVALAEGQLKLALRRDRYYPPALSLLSKLYYRSGRHQDAIRMLEEARAASEAAGQPLPVEVLAGLALHYEAIERPDLASAIITRMPRQSREDAGSTAVYVVLRGESPDSAADLAARAVRDDSKSAVNQNNYGITRLRAGDPKSAEEAFRKAIDLDPALPGPYYNLAILEKYYVFDDAAASRWFKLYWERSNDDPDRLADLIGKGKPKEIAEQRNER